MNEDKIVIVPLDKFHRLGNQEVILSKRKTEMAEDKKINLLDTKRVFLKKKKESNLSYNPWLWVPSLYFAQGLPYILINGVSGCDV